MKIARALRVLVPMALVAFGALTARADVSRIDVKTREDVLNGKAWGSAGAYERIIGTVHFTVDPKNAHNKAIPNIENAPRNAQGMVEYTADLYIYAPKDPSKGNGVALFEVPNRGGRGMFGRFSNAVAAAGGGRGRGADAAAPDPAAEFGDGSLLNSGYTLVWVGWQFSLARGGAQIGIDLPTAEQDGKPIEGRVVTPITAGMSGPTLNLDPDAARYPPVDMNSPDATLSVVVNVYDTPRVIARDQWQFAKMTDGQVTPDPTSLYMKDGFKAGYTYTLSYTGKNTPVGGLGYSALRDVGSYFKKPGNLVSAKYDYVVGESQTGRFLREFLYDGYNADEQGKKVFDLVWSHIAGAARGDFTQPFTLPNGLGIFTGSMFPYSPVPEKDPVTGNTDGLLMHMSKDVVPKVVFTNGDCEYWGGGRAGALVTTTLDGKKDAKLPDNVRVYMMAGTQHVIAAFPPNAGQAQQKTNPNNYRWAMRAILDGVDQWVRMGSAPPASRYPNYADGTLVAQQDLHFPALPGVQSPSIIPGGYRADLGDAQKATKIPFLVSKVDADGNDLGGIRLPDVAVPLATYTGWNFRNPANGPSTEIVPLNGSFIPFPATRADKDQAKDPRQSIEERYPSRDAYLAKVKEAAMNLVKERYVLPGDVDAIVAHAGVVWDNVTAGPLKSEK
jgi:hypothetical protein